jgi:phosphomannomutase
MAGIFKAYDIRGIVGETLNQNKAFLIGRGLAQEIYGGEGLIVVSRDMQVHSEVLTQALIEGLLEGGCDVIDIGLAATPQNYWANVTCLSSGGSRAKRN